MTGRLVHTGQAVVDLVMRVEALPPPGGDVLASDVRFTAGGGFTVLAAAARAGAEVVYAGEHGTGRFGDLVRDALAAEGVELVQPPVTPDTGVCVVLVDAAGERTFITETGAEGTLTAEHLHRVRLRAGDLVYVTGYSLVREANRDALLEWLPSAAGHRVLLDPGPLAADVSAGVWRAVLPHVDILTCNAAEAAVLSTVDGVGGVPVRITRVGAAGCDVVARGTTVRVPGFPVEPVDTNGAGDAHAGVLAAELLRGAPVLVAAGRANAAAAIAVQRYGPATAPSRAEVDELLAATRR
ncbi:PfkB family carbohydrate kinase [Amycolatopsis sp. NBC_01488]|uniref:PfkB family carbohydrate kinase n=1 Tax=Amycolatopsis sp. NBC_01488 TaxID=2903563 RepID=UPI002E2E754E|nr:PfkB family carbohydrate kinase [Amycolatopsis sp. NBC_01488]